ncbi:MAG TPA: hypothetical protein PK127_09755 [Clostridiales bacterium]|jgi:hypothetical protein|nr:hypothetical protein [Clostridiaceae bacterium]HOQ08160.1 hypothetical protein [Clostridiales bacterium]HPV02745.1 hypothetical protein [Clostridiales bacterium]
MEYIQVPNLPEGRVGLAVVDGRISPEAEDTLRSLGMELIRLHPHPGLYDAVCCHPDMVLHHVGGNVIVYAPGTDAEAVSKLGSYGFRMVMGESILTPKYPYDIAYNVARVGKWYFHNLKYTDRRIREYMDRLGIEPVHVEQGYAKCSILPVDGNSIITTDRGIERAAAKKGIDVLYVECGDSIRLPGLDRGFIGGACGMISDTVCAINGSVEKLKGSDPIISFLSSRNMTIVQLSDECVTDIGSIIPLALADPSN